MGDPGWERIKAVFQAASAVEGAEREELLERECAEAIELRREVESLLEAQSVDPVATGAGAAALGPVDESTADSPPTEHAGMRIGRYNLLERIGSGGFGEVWLAEQKSPLRRKVALKILKAGMDSREVLARFEAERQALAVMDHPSVAKVFDAGAAENGRPYFVMEHVPGVPITNFCDSSRLRIKKRLRLFMEVCQAVQHAHQKGIIHRDLKPTNILVAPNDKGESASSGSVATVKVIDFGIAKATIGRLTERTLYTETGRLIGTPEYMSPEQTGTTGLDVDTRSDIYSLGVLLYQLLTGTLPFDAKALRGAGFDGIAKVICEQEPARPSTRLSTMMNEPVNRMNGVTPETIGKSRDCDFRVLQRELRGDLDWITMKALEKDRTRRYESAAALMEDLQRHMAGEPVEAVPPSYGYRATKFVKKNRGQLIVATFVVALLVMGMCAFAWQWQRAEAALTREVAERRRADREAQEARRQAEQAHKQTKSMELTADCLGGILQGVKASVARGRDTALLREMLESAAERINAGELRDSPETELRLRWTLGEAYLDIAAEDSLRRAEEMLLPTVELAESTYGSESEEIGVSLGFVGACLRSLGRAGEALPIYQAALDVRRRLYKHDHAAVATSLNNLADCLQTLGRAADALSEYRAALEIQQRLYEGDHPDVATCLNNVAACLQSLGRSAEALSKHLEALEMLQRLYQGDHPHVASGLNNVAYCLETLGRVDEALPKYQAALEMAQRLYEGDHPDVAQGQNNVAACLRSLGHAAEALPKHQAALQMQQRLYKGDHPHIGTSLNNVGVCLQSLGRANEALPVFEMALRMSQRLYNGDHPDVATRLNNLATCLRALGRPVEALPQYVAALEMRQRLYEGDHPYLAQSLSSVAACLESLDRADEALPTYHEAFEMSARVVPPEHPYFCYSRAGLARVLTKLNRFVEAEALLLEAERQINNSPATPAAVKCGAMELLVGLYESWHAVEPDRGFDRKAAKWRKELIACQSRRQ